MSPVRSAHSRTASAVLDADFLEVRAKLLEVAASLDRIDRAVAAARVANDERLAGIAQSLAILADGRPDRAERIQLVFSDEYQAGWNVAR
ncbi:MAG: hypothetical protein WD066_10635 [Planctomycetaceae bacterium]